MLSKTIWRREAVVNSIANKFETNLHIRFVVLTNLLMQTNSDLINFWRF